MRSRFCRRGAEGLSLKALCLLVPQMPIGVAPLEQGGMGREIEHLAAFEHQDGVGIGSEVKRCDTMTSVLPLAMS